MGLLSMAVAGLFMVGQRDFKRMLAYSSVEHMGILVLGLGIGAPALYGTLLHVVTNGLTKGVLFLSAGNIHRAFGSKNTERGARRDAPAAALRGRSSWLGFLAITGSPPFGPVHQRVLDPQRRLRRGTHATGGLFLLFLLLVVFIGMGATVLKPSCRAGVVRRRATRRLPRERSSPAPPLLLLGPRAAARPLHSRAAER